MFLNKTHHVAIIVSDYEKSREFYVEKLELPVKRENYREDRGDYKLDLQVGDIEEAVEWLHNKGIETEPIRMDEFTQKRMTFFRDPDNLPLELHE